MEDRNLSLSAVAGTLGVSERTVRRWIQSGKLRAYKPGRDYRIPESALRELVEESEITSPKDLSPRLPLEERGELTEDGWNDALEYGQRLADLYERLHAIQQSVDKYREGWERRLANGDFDKAAIEEAGRALKAFWPAVTTAADAEQAEIARAGILFEEAMQQAVLLPAIARFQVLCDRVNAAYRELLQDAPAANLYMFPHREAS
jgi:excisionase family DNA binding protein